MDELLKIVFATLLASHEFMDHPSYSVIVVIKQSSGASVSQFSLAGGVVKVRKTAKNKSFKRFLFSLKTLVYARSWKQVNQKYRRCCMALEEFLIDNGPSRYEIMIAQWHHDFGGNEQERLKFTIRKLGSSKSQIVYLEIISSTRLLDDNWGKSAPLNNGRYWNFTGRIFSGTDPLRLMDQKSTDFQIERYDVQTRNGFISFEV